MASSQMIVSLTVADFENIVQRAVLSALSGKSVPVTDGKKMKKAKKEKDPNAPKKEPNDWIKFTTKVREVLKAANIKAGVEVTQFCGMLKNKNADYASWTPEAILTEHSGWTRPEVSKQALASKSAEPSPASATDAKKARKPQSEETKKAAAEKRAATKAAKAAASAPLPASPAPKAPAAKASAPAPAPPAAEDEDSATDFAPWTFKKASYLKNKRGDVLSEEYDWIGRFDEKTGKIDRAFPKPADLEEE